MTTDAGQLGRGVYCPVCGYDLRGTPGGRCSECGTEVGRVGRSVSRIPWVHRRYRGRMRAYLQTMGLVLFRTWRLAEEAKGRVALRDARGFHRVSVVVGTVIGTGLTAAGFALPGMTKPNVAEGSFWIAPAFAVVDRWWAVVPLAASVWLTLVIGLACFRALLRLGSTGLAAERVWRVGYYASGVAVVETAAVGLLYLNRRFDEWIQSEWWRPHPSMALIQTLYFVLGVAVVLGMVIPGTVLLARTGRWRALRVILAVVAYPAMVGLIGTTMLLAVFWAVGYVAMAIRSMTW